MVQSAGAKVPWSHGNTVIRFCLPHPQELGQSPFPKADSTVRGKGGGHSASETHKDRQTTGVRNRAENAGAFQGWKGYQVPKLDLQPPPSGSQATFIGPGQVPLSWSPSFSSGFSLMPCEPSTFQHVPNRLPPIPLPFVSPALFSKGKALAPNSAS